jgi:RNA polymerase sigma-70 factor (ECF subfamily)
MESDERERLERFRRGEPGAFNVLYAEYGPRLYRFGLRLCGGAVADAEDLTQEVFLAAFRSLHQFEGRSSLSTYLYRIAVYRWRQMKDARCRGEETLDDGREPAAPAASSDPARLGAARMEMDAALASLPAAQRAAFLLVKSEGLTCKEAADALGIPVGTVKYHVHEAVLRLRAFLGHGAEEHDAL